MRRPAFPGLEDLRADPVVALGKTFSVAAPVPRFADDDQHDVGTPSRRRDQLRRERAAAVERNRVEEDVTLAEPVDECRPDQRGCEGLVGPAVAEEGRGER
jgi:hypothetical protein